MKNALILHGTDGDSQMNWFPWLKKNLETNGFAVFCPDLPYAEKPNIDRYFEFISTNQDWKFNEESILIGHSSGAVAILGILERLPPDIQVDTCYLVGSFKDDLGWDSLSELFEKPLDFPKIKSKAKKFVFIHSDNDPYCPLDQARFLSKQLDGYLVVLIGQGHFSVTSNPKYTQFPELLKLIVTNDFSISSA